MATAMCRVSIDVLYCSLRKRYVPCSYYTLDVSRNALPLSSYARGVMSITDDLGELLGQ